MSLESVYSKNNFYGPQILFHHTTTNYETTTYLRSWFAALVSIASFGQPKPEDSTVSNQKFYFPYSFYNDPAALDKAIPALAKKLLVVYSGDNNKSTCRKNSFCLIICLAA